MLRLTERRRGLLTEKLPDLANLAIGALVFGQFLGAEPFSYRLLAMGILLWVVLMTAAWLGAGERR